MLLRPSRTPLQIHGLRAQAQSIHKSYSLGKNGKLRHSPALFKPGAARFHFSDVRSRSAAFGFTRIPMGGIQPHPVIPPALFTNLVRKNTATKKTAKSNSSNIQAPFARLPGRRPPIRPLPRNGLCQEYCSRCPQKAFRR